MDRALLSAHCNTPLSPPMKKKSHHLPMGRDPKVGKTLHVGQSVFSGYFWGTFWSDERGGATFS